MSSSWDSVVSQGRDLLHGFTRLVYPNTCWVCNGFISSPHDRVCSICRPSLINDPFPACPRCSSTVGPHLVLDKGCPACHDRSFAFDGALRMAPYEGLLREVILRMKNRSGEELTEVIGALWANRMAERLRPWQVDVVVPVPLHWTRQCWRGFNQSAILAACLAKQLGTPCVNALRRVRRTGHQKRLQSMQTRTENVRHAFQCRRGYDLAGRTIVLVDDVMTTGATANESARTLKVLRPKAIYVGVLAHG
jgi:ComF family protein